MSVQLDPKTGEPVGTHTLTGTEHPSVISSYELDRTSGSTAISTFEGHKFDIFDPDTWVFDLEDIAQSLSNICRFGGHVEFYSVAEHCVRVADWLKHEGYDTKTQLMGLMHDAVEAYIGDIVRPIKKTFSAQGEYITDLERSLEYCMFQSYGILDDGFDETWKHIKNADMAVYAMERDERPNVGFGLLPKDAKLAWMITYNNLQALIGE